MPILNLTEPCRPSPRFSGTRSIQFNVPRSHHDLFLCCPILDQRTFVGGNWTSNCFHRPGPGHGHCALHVRRHKPPLGHSFPDSIDRAFCHPATHWKSWKENNRRCGAHTVYPFQEPFTHIARPTPNAFTSNYRFNCGFFPRYVARCWWPNRSLH